MKSYCVYSIISIYTSATFDSRVRELSGSPAQQPGQSGDTLLVRLRHTTQEVGGGKYKMLCTAPYKSK